MTIQKKPREMAVECKANGCYRFASNTPERTVCEGDCWLSKGEETIETEPDPEKMDIEKVRKKTAFVLEMAEIQVSNGVSPNLMFFLQQIATANLEFCEELKKAYDASKEIERQSQELQAQCREISQHPGPLDTPEMRKKIARTTRLYEEFLQKYEILEGMISEKSMTRISKINSVFLDFLSKGVIPPVPEPPGRKPDSKDEPENVS